MSELMQAAAPLSLSNGLAELSVTERAELGRYEAVIQRGLATFTDVARALITIRDDRLYRGAHATFEDYCLDRWGFTGSRARQLFAATEVAENLESVTTGNTFTERQLRPLTRLEKEQQIEAYTAALEVAVGGRPTAAQVQFAADSIKPRPGGSREIKPVRDANPPTPTLPPAKVTYTAEPLTPRDWDDTATEPPSAEELAAMAEVAAERAAEEQERVKMSADDKAKWLDRQLAAYEADAQREVDAIVAERQIEPRLAKAQSLRDCLATACDRSWAEYIGLFPDRQGDARALEVAIMRMIGRLDDEMYALRVARKESR